MSKSAKKTVSAPDTAPLEIIEVKHGVLDVFILGITPHISNRMAEKAKRELLLPRGRMNAAAKTANLKHDPLTEYRDSVYRLKDPKAHTWIAMPATAFKGAMRTAALDIPGVTARAVDRLVYIDAETVAIFGIPALKMDVVKMAGIQRTPDIRTRAAIRHWAAKITIKHAEPMVGQNAAANLLAGGGVISGVGDFRQEKGKGNFGMFEVVQQDNPKWLEIVANGGREAQIAAMKDPAFFDDESEELYTWFEAEIGRRDRTEALAKYRKAHDDWGVGAPA